MNFSAKIGSYGGMWRNWRLQVLIPESGPKCTKVKVSVLRWRFWWTSAPPAPQNLHLAPRIFTRVIFTRVKVLEPEWRFFGPIFAEWRLVKVLGLYEIFSTSSHPPPARTKKWKGTAPLLDQNERLFLNNFRKNVSRKKNSAAKKALQLSFTLYFTCSRIKKLKCGPINPVNFTKT